MRTITAAGCGPGTATSQEAPVPRYQLINAAGDIATVVAAVIMVLTYLDNGNDQN